MPGPAQWLRDTAREAYHRMLLDRADRVFPFWERHGLHIIRNSYDSPVPDSRLLSPEVLTRRSELPGVELNEQRQLELLESFAARFGAEYARFPRDPDPAFPRFHLANGAFEAGDAEVAYSMVRASQPRRLVEVGCGHSTRCMTLAVAANAAESGHVTEYTAIDPFAAHVAGLPEVTRYLPRRVETLPLELFTSLDRGDILFIDSPHVVTTGGAVQWLYLEVLPRLRPGVLVQVHDVFLPAEYPAAWLREEKRFYNEQYLLQAFLAFNSCFEVLWMGSWMHLTHPAELAAAIPSYDPRSDWPGSFWMRRTG